MMRNGFSLVELMVALLLGSLISIAATQLFLVNRQADNLQQGLSVIQDQGRFIFSYLSRDLMQAGYDDLAAIEPFEFDSSKAQHSIDHARYDELVIKMNGGLNCRGAQQTYPMIKRYHVGGNKNLICAERYRDPATGTWQDSDSESLVDNVEAFQVLYGIDVDTAAGQEGYGYADAYANANSIRLAQASGAPLRIVSVRFGILLSSDRPAGLDASRAPESIAVLDQSVSSDEGVALDDGRLYRTYTSTVALRNQVEL